MVTFQEWLAKTHPEMTEWTWQDLKKFGNRTVIPSVLAGLGGTLTGIELEKGAQHRREKPAITKPAEDTNKPPPKKTLARKLGEKLHIVKKQDIP